MLKQPSLAHIQRDQVGSYDEEFFDDMHMIFLGMGRGEASKYMYDNFNTSPDTNLWEEILKASSDYYVPKAENELFQSVRKKLAQYIPEGTGYVDFGIGGTESFKRYVLPIMDLLKSNSYIGIDCDYQILEQTKKLQSDLKHINIQTMHADFFKPTNRVISETPALGVMNGITLGNMYGSLSDKQIDANLIGALRYLSQLTYFGWLLVSIDTNQDADSLMKMYRTPLNSRLNIASLPRMAEQLPVTDFNPKLFTYDPEWLPEQQLVAHMAIATESQDFNLGNYPIQVRKGDRVHLFNSYKFRKDFFESCCPKANLNIVDSWEHETGIAFYLLKNNLRQ